MTITYPDGAVFEAILLSHEKDKIRVAVAGCDDAMVFTRIHRTWVSEDIDPVGIEFHEESHVPGESDCICPKELYALSMDENHVIRPQRLM